MANETSQPTGLNSFMTTVTAWLTGKDARLTELETKLATLSSVETQLAQCQKDLTTARQTIGSLEAEVEKLTAANTDLAKKAENAAEVSTATITEAANALAGQRLATIGVLPVKEEISAEQNRSGNLFVQFAEESDPEKRAAIYRRIKAEVWSKN